MRDPLTDPVDTKTDNVSHMDTGWTPEQVHVVAKRAENIAYLGALSRVTGGRIYEGTVTRAVKLKRRAKNRVARRTRAQQRTRR